MGILVSNNQKKKKIPLEKVRLTAQAVLNALEYPEAELSLVICDDAEIALLNRQYLDREGPTNVIAFPMLEGEFSDVAAQMIGDVVISVETAQREADDGGLEFETRFNELLVHGILHLLGYDHENDMERAREMEEKSAELMAVVRDAGL